MDKRRGVGKFPERGFHLVDCDNDTLLIKANPVGPVCHTGADTCFFETNKASGISF
jgi:phosphoribosyl-AMP cyclohydrolase / phosphoribosyl-ATP pyrophosphohydrolase